jgi:phosphoglycerate dehydrogenase-like enzyme
VLPEADFLLVATPLTAETRGMVGAAELAVMKPTAGIVNIGRAAVMDYDALVAALRAGKFSGAILDVFNPSRCPRIRRCGRCRAWSWCRTSRPTT